MPQTHPAHTHRHCKFGVLLIFRHLHLKLLLTSGTDSAASQPLKQDIRPQTLLQPFLSVTVQIVQDILEHTLFFKESKRVHSDAVCFRRLTAMAPSLIMGFISELSDLYHVYMHL